jgi:hypothetical protein
VAEAGQPAPFSLGLSVVDEYGRFAAYEMLGGVRLRTQAEVAWELPEGRYVYWRAAVLAAELCA